MWHPGPVTPPRSLGNSVYRLPGGLRSLVPRTIRESIRQRVGPFAPWESGFSADAPPPPSGTVTGPPDFVGIGAQKSGTTWWFELLAGHPQVHHPAHLHKERHYFGRYADAAFDPAAVAGYHRWFPRPPGTITGEWTPDYLSQPWVPPLLALAAPDARLLVILRDPIERFVSGVAHAEIRPGSNLGDALADAVQRGFYAAALRPWLDRFTGDRLLVLQYERCIADPLGQLARTFAFLELEDVAPAGDVRALVSPTTTEKRRLDPDARRRLAELYAGDMAALEALVPELDLELWPAFARA